MYSLFYLYFLPRNLIQSYLKCKLIFKYYVNICDTYICIFSPDFFLLQMYAFQASSFRYLVGISKVMSWFFFVTYFFPSIFLSVNRATLICSRQKLRGIITYCSFLHIPLPIQVQNPSTMYFKPKRSSPSLVSVLSKSPWPLTGVPPYLSPCLVSCVPTVHSLWSWRGSFNI